MWSRKRSTFGRNAEFFLIGLSHDNLTNHFKTNFQLVQHHKYSLTELELMMPWEREIYLMLLEEHIKEENERIRLEQQTRK